MNHEDMAAKTVTIKLDRDAYRILAGYRHKGQSWSQVVRERLGMKPQLSVAAPSLREKLEVIPPIATTSDLKRALKKVSVSDETLSDMESIVRSRAESPARMARL